MHRLLVDAALLEADSPELPRDAARHLKVLRPKAGERIELFDGCGGSREYAFDGALRAAGSIRRVAPPCRRLTLFACVTKGSRWDWTIEKATELGVTRIVPVISERTIVRLDREERTAKRERWLRIAEDAARQSDALFVPEIAVAMDFAEALAEAEKGCCFVGALTVPPSPPLAKAIAEAAGASGDLSVFIGPEGDFTPAELSALCRVAHPTSFGNTVLRAETAAIFAVSVLRALSVTVVS